MLSLYCFLNKVSFNCSYGVWDLIPALTTRVLILPLGISDSRGRFAVVGFLPKKDKSKI